MRLSLLLLPLVTLASFAPRAEAASFILNANLSALPGVQSSGSGFGSVTVSDDQTSAFISLFLSGLNGNVESGTGIYGPGNLFAPGPLVFSLSIPVPSSNSGTFTGTFSLPSGVLANLVAGQLDFIVYTDQFVGGCQVVSGNSQSCQLPTAVLPEIGGQIGSAASAPEPATASVGLALAGLGVVGWRRRRVTV